MTYVLSDIHGDLQSFEDMLRQINLQPEDTLYILGDVIDRGEHGIELLQRIMAMPNAKMLLGNHEYMMMNALRFPRSSEDIIYEEPKNLFKLWYRNGGKTTHKAWKMLSEKEQTDIKLYLKALPLNIDVTVNGVKYRLIHAAEEDGYEIFGEKYGTRTCYCVWERKAVFLARQADCTVIFGHTPTIMLQSSDPMEIFRQDGLIGIDCGCGVKYHERAGRKGEARGRLACLRLDDMREFYTEADVRNNEQKG